MKYKKKSVSAQNRDYNRSAAYHTSTSQIRIKFMTTSATSIESKGCEADTDISDRILNESPITVRSDILVDTSVVCSSSGLISTLNESVNHDLLTVEPEHTPTID